MEDSNQPNYNQNDHSNYNNEVFYKELSDKIISPSIALTDHSDIEESSVPLLRKPNYDSFYKSPSDSCEVLDSQKSADIKNEKDALEFRKSKSTNPSVNYLKEKVKFITKMHVFASTLIPAAIILVLTNSAQPLLIFLLRQYGGTPPGAYFFLFPTYLGMICVGLYPTKKLIWQENWIYPAILAGIDFLHQLIEKAGLLYCGPCLYTVASSTNTLFLALFTALCLNIKITKKTVLSLAVISLAVSLGGSGKLCEITPTHLIGFAMVIFASMLNALNFVIGELFLKQNKIEGPNLVCIMGLISLIALSLWTCFWTVPNWNIITENVKINVKATFTILVVLFFLNFIRSSVYWIIIKRAGSIFTGVLKCLRIVIVIIVSHFLFSHIDHTQKITYRKVLTALMCSTGIVLYSMDNNSKIKSYKEEANTENDEEDLDDDNEVETQV